MSYADDLAKDRDKYLRQRNKLAEHVRLLLDNPTPKRQHLARVTLRQIEQSDPISNAVDAALSR